MVFIDPKKCSRKIFVKFFLQEFGVVCVVCVCLCSPIKQSSKK